MLERYHIDLLMLILAACYDRFGVSVSSERESEECCLSGNPFEPSSGGGHVIIGDVCQLGEAFGSSRRQ